MGNDAEKYLSVGYESGAKKAGETITNRALDFVVDSVKKVYKRGSILLGTAFDLYLKNAYKRLNQVKTLATGTDVRSIIKKNGETDLYVKIGVEYKRKTIDTSCVDNLLEKGDNILIVGTGGIGKSMLLRYLFLSSAYDSDYIPVFVELRKISGQTASKISIIELIKECMAQYGVALPEDEFEYSLRSGRYLFLFDALDEVKEELARETAEKIQDFCSKYPKNKCIMTSRHEDNQLLLETFEIMDSMPLDKDLAIELSSKIWEKDEKTVEFCKQLDDELFEKHKSFAENPLLLSMMFLTFMRNLDIPKHLADFYKEAYEAIYSSHDNNDKGFYRRDFKCKNLDKEQFKILFARVCFQTYFKEKYEFSEEEILGYIRHSADFLKFDINENDYLSDLRKAVCLIIKDGRVYRFAHRSFQTYFAAVYTSEKLTDEQQKQLFTDRFFGGKPKFWDYCGLLDQIEHERFTKNAFEDVLRDFYRKAEESSDPNLYILRTNWKSVIKLENFDDFGYCLNEIPIIIALETVKNSFKISRLTHIDKKEKQFMYNIAKNIGTPLNSIGINIDFDDIDNTHAISEEDKKRFYDILTRHTNIPLLRQSIGEWLEQLDRERENLKKKDLIEYL